MSHRRRANQARSRNRTRHLEATAREARRRKVLAIAAIVVAVGLVAWLVSLPSGPQGGLSKDDRAPDFTIVDVDGRTFRLSQQQGKVVLIDFMGSRCSTCVQQMQFLPAVYSAYADKGLVMISIDVGGSLGTEDPEVARRFMATYGGTWPIALDNSGIGLAYGVPSLPTLYLLRTDGTIAFRHAAGVITDHDLAAQIEPLL